MALSKKKAISIALALADEGVVIPLGDLLIGATALSLGYSVGTVNLRHFGKVPGLTVVQF